MYDPVSCDSAGIKKGALVNTGANSPVPWEATWRRASVSQEVSGPELCSNLGRIPTMWVSISLRGECRNILKYEVPPPFKSSPTHGIIFSSYFNYLSARSVQKHNERNEKSNNHSVCFNIIVSNTSMEILLFSITFRTTLPQHSVICIRVFLLLIAWTRLCKDMSTRSVTMAFIECAPLHIGKYLTLFYADNLQKSSDACET